MNISRNWMNDYLSCELSPMELADALTSIGLETSGVKEIETIRGGLKGLVVGQVIDCERHPRSDHLHVATVDLGDGRRETIVCGASNVAAGQKVVVALPGAMLYAGEERHVIRKSKIRGVESNGMICAEDEIGIGSGHEGIIVLPDDVRVGMAVKDYYGIVSDFVLEVDITPNRIDAASHFGVARDLAARLVADGKTVVLKRPAVDAFEVDDPMPGIRVRVENGEACRRYSGVTVRDVEVKASPDWLRNRLEAIGIRSINNVVDVTNYVLHETGQPLHAFDVRRIKGGEICVKTLAEGTHFVTLDGVERRLSADDLMICNAEEGMCIGGVFGGLDSGVTEATRDVFLESACFHPAWIRRTARQHDLHTDASFRFERGTDPNNTLYALKRAALLVKGIAGGRICGEVEDVYPCPVRPVVVKLNLRKMSALIGQDIPEDTVEKILSDLEIEIESRGDENWTLRVPTYRVDVTRDVDVVEEILRIYGYNRIVTGKELHTALAHRTPTDRSYGLQNLISEQLTGNGFNEIVNNSLSADSYYVGLTSFPEDRCVRLRNPLSTDLDVMRQTLLFGGLESIVYNRNRKSIDLKFYEFGNTCFFLPSECPNDERGLAAIKETKRLGLWLTGNSTANHWMHSAEKASVYGLKACVENILLRMGLPVKRLVYTPYSDDLLAAGLSVASLSGRLLGVLGIVRSTVCKRFDIPVEVCFAELDWDALMKENRLVRVIYNDLSKFHPVKRDLALLLDKTVSFAEIEKIAYQTDRKTLKEVSLFDVYEGANLPEGKKSYAVSFTLQDEEKTLNDKQIDSLMARIRKNLEDRAGARLR
jgi:phenylalanyl-tRNA synthetase beta chain